MGEAPGLDLSVEIVYRAMLANPEDGPDQLATRLGMTAEDVRSCLDQLSGLALVRTSSQDCTRPRTVSPHLALNILLTRQRAELSRLQEHQETIRQLAGKLTTNHSPDVSTSDGETVHLQGIESIRDHLEALNSQVAEDCLTLAPGGPQTAANMHASRELSRRLLDRGVAMRTIYLDGIRRDKATAEHAGRLMQMGAQVRTLPSLPNRMVVFDRQVALVATNSRDTSEGAVVTTTPGVLDTFCALFELLWASAQPIDTPLVAEPGELTRQQVEALQLMAEGRTDESIAKHLEVSLRTARRITTSILVHFNARSRFQAGVYAVQHGYLPAQPR